MLNQIQIHRAFHQWTQCLHGGQMESLWGKRQGLELRAEPSIPPVITVPPGGQTESFVRKEAGLWLTDDRLYSAILRLSWADSLRSHAVLHEWLAFYSVFFEYPPKWVYLQHWHGWCHMKLAAVSAQVLCTPYSHAPLSHHAKPQSSRALFHQSAQYHLAVRWKVFVRKEAGLGALFHQSAQHDLAVRWKVLLRKEAGLRALFHQSAQHHLVVVWGKGLRAQDTKPSVPPVNTVPTWWSRWTSLWGESRGLGLRAKPVIPPVNIAPPGGQMEWLCAKRRGLELRTQNPLFVRSTQHHQVVRWKVLWAKEAGLRALFRQSTQHHLMVRWKVLWGKGRGLELRAKPSIPPINQVLHGGQMEKIVTKEAGA